MLESRDLDDYHELMKMDEIARNLKESLKYDTRQEFAYRLNALAWLLNAFIDTAVCKTPEERIKRLAIFRNDIYRCLGSLANYEGEIREDIDLTPRLVEKVFEKETELKPKPQYIELFDEEDVKGVEASMNHLLSANDEGPSTLPPDRGTGEINPFTQAKLKGDESGTRKVISIRRGAERLSEGRKRKRTLPLQKFENEGGPSESGKNFVPANKKRPTGSDELS